VEPLRSIARIRALSPEEAARNLPVAIEAMVTYYDSPRPSLLAHDGSEGIFVPLSATLKERPAFGPGSRLLIEGVTQPGGFLPIVEAHRITVLGEGPLPKPRRIDGSEIFSPSLDCQWVEVPAVITGVERSSGLVLVAEVSGWTVKLLTPQDGQTIERATALMQQPVLVQGVVGTVFNDHRQLTARHFFVPSFEQIIPIGINQPDEEPQLRAINELLRSDANSRTRVRIRGTITHAASDALYLRGEGGSVLVRTANPGDFVPGMQVEAEGFPAVALFRPILRATRVTVLHRGTQPLPEPLDLSRENIVQQQAELVAVEADFLTRRDGPGDETVLQCRRDKWYFEALINDRTTLPQDLAANDRLRLTGICELTTTRTLPFASAVDGFRLHLRNADDVTILRRAPWWTLRRLLWAFGFIGALALIAIVWAALLRRRVAEQTKIIGDQIERAVVKDERQRIARELHDTIEQELAGLSIQLRNARQRLVQDPEQAGTAIELAQRMLRHCRNEARTSIRDLRSVALEQRGLPGTLEELLSPLAAEAGVQFTLNVGGTPRGLAGPVEIHLLRIAQQAVANAVQHGAPGEIRVQLSYAADEVALEVRDNGRGFDPAAPAPRGHFGIIGIRERANKVHARLTLESAPGAGTTIRVVVPAKVAAPGNGHSL
jgi:signal transduction histidine kinase